MAGSPFDDDPRIYTLGHRNPQGLALRADDTMWVVERGPSVDDEINLLTNGGNYGWSPWYESAYVGATPMTDLVEHEDAVEAKWSSGDPTLDVGGATFLDGDWWGDWDGRLAVATLKAESLRLFEFNAAGNLVSHVVPSELDGDYGQLRTPMMGPDGALTSPPPTAATKKEIGGRT